MAVQRRTARPKSVSEIMKAVHNYLFYRDQESTARKQKERAYTPAKADKSLLPAAIKANGHTDDEGHTWWHFREPLAIDGHKYTGLKWQRNGGDAFIDPDRAQKLAKRKNVEHLVTETSFDLAEATPTQVAQLFQLAQKAKIPVRIEQVWDYDEFYTLRQRHIITEEELDGLIVPAEAKYSLVVLEDG